MVRIIELWQSGLCPEWPCRGSRARHVFEPTESQLSGLQGFHSQGASQWADIMPALDTILEVPRSASHPACAACVQGRSRHSVQELGADRARPQLFTRARRGIWMERDLLTGMVPLPLPEDSCWSQTNTRRKQETQGNTLTIFEALKEQDVRRPSANAWPRAIAFLSHRARGDWQSIALTVHELLASPSSDEEGPAARTRQQPHPQPR